MDVNIQITILASVCIVYLVYLVRLKGIRGNSGISLYRKSYSLFNRI